MIAPVLPYFGPSARLDHVGFAVRSIKDIAPDARVFHDPIQNVNVGFVTVGGVRWELVEAAAIGSPVATMLANGRSLYHLCYEVDDLEAALAMGRKFGFHRLRPPVPAVAFGGRLICWMFSRSLGFFELLSAGPVDRGDVRAAK